MSGLLGMIGVMLRGDKIQYIAVIDEKLHGKYYLCRTMRSTNDETINKEILTLYVLSEMRLFSDFLDVKEFEDKLRYL